MTSDPSSEHAGHQRVMEILADALEMPRDDRAAFLEKVCSEDRALRAEIDRLLGQEAAADASLKTGHAHAVMLDSLKPPEQIGSCRIIRELGHGGMSIVYLAMQQSPVKRPVAIKLLLPGMDTREILRRFESEREALAKMSHPNVAQVYDAGTTATGRPYFVMEYVDGVSITEYCDTHRLTTRSRLELFMPVCEAVQHAHQKAIIHRDLKPSNVLVIERDGKAIPKVIDFGIAKAIDPAGASRTMFTEHGQLLGTPEYMSPEQASMGGTDIDTRTDVYSLGVLLYELLTGSLPFESSTLRGAAYDEIRRMIREVDPPRPSTRLSAGEGGTEVIARARQADPKSLLRHVRGDLDWITMKALEKDRQRRYASPAELASDLKRHLDDEPVVARPPSAGYRVGKFVHRHRLAVTAAALLVLCLAGGIVGTSMATIRARRAERAAIQQKELAQKRFNDVRELARTLIFDVDDAMEKSGVTKARQLLVETASKYLDELSRQPGVIRDREFAREIVRGYERVGRVQYFPAAPSLDNPKGAILSYQKALELGQQLLTEYPNDRTIQNDVAMLHMTLGDAMHVVNGPNIARQSFDKAISLAQSLVDSDPTDARARRCIVIACGRLSQGYRDQHNGAEAMKWNERQLKMNRELLAADPQDEAARRGVAHSHASIGRLLVEMGSPVNGRQNLETSRKLLIEICGENPEQVIQQRELANSLAYLALAEADCLMLDQALATGRLAVAAREVAAGKDKSSSTAMQDLSSAHAQLARTAAMMGHTKLAFNECNQAIEIQRPLADKKGTSLQSRNALAQMYCTFAEILIRMGKPQDAFDAAYRAQGIVEGSMGMKRQHVGHLPEIAPVDHALGLSNLAQDKPEAALADFTREVEARTRLDEAHANLGNDRYRLVLALISKAEAEMVLNKSADVEATVRQATERAQKLVADAPDAKRYGTALGLAQVVHAEALIASHKSAQATSVLDSAITRLKLIVESAPAFVEAQETLARAEAASGRKDRSEEILRKIVATDPDNASAAARLKTLRSN